MASTASAFTLDPYDYGEVRRIAAALELAEPVAVMLVRRGYRTVESARSFLEARDSHDPLAFAGMEQARELILAAVRDGRRITVHGDYDVDGVTATAILVSALRELGARCDWLIPDRLSDGYGFTEATVEELRGRGTELAITVDCGIGSREEVAAARAAGIEIVVTDHHEPPDEGGLPDCPILHPVVSGYPFSGLCAAGVAHKLATALTGEERDLDLVALATVADLVPLIGENRRLVRQGLAAMRASPRPGLRALMAVARVESDAVDEGAIGFRLAPRINAAGRLYRADAGVELMLTEDDARAAAIAQELDKANAERRTTETRVVEAAERARAELPPELAEAPALVLAGEDWHPGVVGIAASRLAERHWRPTILIGLNGDRGRGSARSIPGFDLIAALDRCADRLIRHGGHRAAAGLELERIELDAFRREFAAIAAEEISEAELTRTESVDALVGVGREGIGMELAEQLERLAPFGKGNPDPRLIVPSARLRTVRPLGEGEKHSRFELESGAGRASGVAFGVNGALSGREDEPIDLSVRLEVDRWNGAVQPRVVLRELYPLEAADEVSGRGVSGCVADACPAPDGEWWERVGAELARADEGWPPALGRRPAEGLSREVVDRRGGAAVAALAELVSSGESVLALCADASRRRELAVSAADPRRFGAGEPLIACARCGSAALDAALGSDAEAEPPAPGPGLVLTDWGALARRPEAARRFRHVVCVDPPPFEALEDFARLGPSTGAGFLHLAWGRAEIELAERCARAEWQLRGAIEQVWRVLSKSGGVAEGERLRKLLTGPGHHPRTAEVAARCVRVLDELGVCEWTSDAAARRLRVLSSERTELERSRAFAACVARHQEATRFLRSRAQKR